MKTIILFVVLLPLAVCAQSPLSLAAEAYQSGNYEKARSILKKEGHKGNLQAQLDLAKLYKNGDGVAQSYKNALYW